MPELKEIIVLEASSEISEFISLYLKKTNQQNTTHVLSHLIASDNDNKCDFSQLCKGAAVIVVDLPALVNEVTSSLGEQPIPVISLDTIALSGDLFHSHDTNVHMLEQPLSLQKLFRLLQRLLDTALSADIEKIQLGNYEFSARLNELSIDNQVLSLTEKEVLIIEMLIQCGTDGATKEQLLDKIWGVASNIDTHTVESHMYRLRQKVAAFEPLIETTENGYQLTAKMP